MSDTPTVFVFEPQAASHRRTVALLEETGVSVVSTRELIEAQSLATRRHWAALLVAHGPEGIELSRYLRANAAYRAPLAALIGQHEEDITAVMVEMNADSFLRRPFSVSTLESFLALAIRFREVGSRVRALETALEAAEVKANRSGLVHSRTGFHQFEAVKDLLVLEVRRAKRYTYPLAVLLVGLDPSDEVEKRGGNLPRDVTSALAAAISKSIRLIDLPVQYADDRILLFFPHTDLRGAEEIGRRIKRRMKHIAYRHERKSTPLTASVGVAALEAGGTATFSKLIKNASAALRAAQLKGGDRLMKISTRSESIV